MVASFKFDFKLKVLPHAQQQHIEREVILHKEIKHLSGFGRLSKFNVETKLHLHFAKVLPMEYLLQAKGFLKKNSIVCNVSDEMNYGDVIVNFLILNIV